MPNQSDTKCYCRGAICGTPRRRWTCPGCKRFLPYCNGHAGTLYDHLCDRCAPKAAVLDGYPPTEPWPERPLASAPAPV